VAGVAWQGQLLAIRALGGGGGDLFDISAGIYWAIGTEVDGVATNTRPADVINMSLGGKASSDTMDEAVQAAAESGVVVIVAAGNDDANASEYTPANAPDSITVAALGHTGGSRSKAKKASYSNFGSTVDVAAPGGEAAEDIDGDGEPDGILSTYGDDVTYYQGTSMASPHVAGLAMLMKALDPNVGQAEARSLLAASADPDIDCSQGCGAGAVSAARTLLAMQNIVGQPFVTASPPVVRVGRGDLDAQITFKNIGDVSADVSFHVGGADRDRIVLQETNTSLGSGESITVELQINRDGEDLGEAEVTATFGPAGESARATVQWTDQVVVAAKNAFVGAVLLQGNDFTVERLVTTSAIDDWKFKLFNLVPGTYLVVALTDDDDDGELEDNEGVGVFERMDAPQRLEVAAEQTVENANFLVLPGFGIPESPADGTGAVGAGCATSAECQGDLYCEPALTGGYCTASCVNGASCPTGSRCFCLGQDANNCAYEICLKDCAGDGDCRASEGYTCDADSTCFPG
jgi:serine protease